MKRGIDTPIGLYGMVSGFRPDDSGNAPYITSMTYGAVDFGAMRPLTRHACVNLISNLCVLAVRNGSNTPMLHVWILGNGDAVQALWTEGSKAACYRCLRKSGPGGEKQERYPVLKHPPQRGQIACRAFTPYAVSAAMQSAALATEMIVDWLKRADPSPRYRTRSADNVDSHKVKNQNPDRLANCPACANAR